MQVGRGIQFLETHFFTIPALATPAQAIGVDDASSSAAAPWVFTHINASCLTVGSAVIGNDMVVELHIGTSQCAVFGGAALDAHAPKSK
jgi:hypothetical protein